ncbi:MAG: antibiotic biosynthesis monooxygenase family protein [Lutibacter sp.]
MIATTIKPPYYAVIFTSVLKSDELEYFEMAKKMETLVKSQPGFLGIETARTTVGITVSYWESLLAIKKWKMNLEHQKAQELGKTKWYEKYKIRICKVERDYEF